MEKLLSTEELDEISKESINFPIIEHPYLLIGPKTYKTIIGKSPKKGSIMVFGNDDTGFQHINIRHGYRDAYDQWKKENPDELDDPTCFPKGEFLAFNWANIVDEIFENDNINIENNKYENVFDLYIGNYIHEENQHDCYLLLYRNTKIIHTLYLKLKNKIYNKSKPKGFHFIKGKITCTIDFEKNFELLIIPYLDNKNEKRFQIEVTRFGMTQQEEWILKFKKENKHFIMYLRKCKSLIRLEERIPYYDFFGLDEIEIEIGRINKMSLAEVMKRCKK